MNRDWVLIVPFGLVGVWGLFILALGIIELVNLYG